MKLMRISGGILILMREMFNRVASQAWFENLKAMTVTLSNYAEDLDNNGSLLFHKVMGSVEGSTADAELKAFGI